MNVKYSAIHGFFSYFIFQNFLIELNEKIFNLTICITMNLECINILKSSKLRWNRRKLTICGCMFGSDIFGPG